MKFIARVVAPLVIALSIYAQPSVGAESVTLVSQSPLWVLKGQNVEFVLESSAELEDVSLYISESPLVGRSSLDSYLSNTLDTSSREIQNFSVSRDSNLVTITLNRISLSNSGVYVVEIREGNTSLLQTLLSYSNNSGINPLNTVLLWSISSPPTQNPLDESLVEDFWQDNQGLEEALRVHPLDTKLSWLVDPDVISFATNNGSEEWIESLKSATSNSDIYVSPFANADVNALVKARKMKLAEAAMSSVLPVTSVLEQSNIPRVILSNAFSRRTWDWIEKQGIYLSITSSQQYPSSTSVFTPSGIIQNPNQKKSLVVDRRTSKFMNKALESNSPRDVQVLQADLFITALEQPQANRTMVLHPTLWNIKDGSKKSVLDIFTSPWLKPRKASEAIRQDVSDQRSLRDIATSELSKTQHTLIDNLETYRKRLSPFIAESIHDTQSIHASLRVASTFKENRRLIVEATEEFFENLLNAVSIVSSGSVIFATESGVIPLTIRNDLSVGVLVNVVAKGFPEVRVRLGTVDFVEIGAGQRKSIEIPATLYGSENAFVDVQLVDALGKKIGEPKRIEIASSAYSTIAGVFVSVAFGLLFLLLIYNTQKRIRASRVTTLENSPRE